MAQNNSRYFVPPMGSTLCHLVRGYCCLMVAHGHHVFFFLDSFFCLYPTAITSSWFKLKHFLKDITTKPNYSFWSIRNVQGLSSFNMNGECIIPSTRDTTNWWTFVPMGFRIGWRAQEKDYDTRYLFEKSKSIAHR